MDEMSEWQPARVKDVHHQWGEGCCVLENKVVHIRKARTGEKKMSGCPHFAQICQSDVDSILPPYVNDGRFMLCEHEIRQQYS